MREQEFNAQRIQIDTICTLPKATAASEKMVIRGARVGEGASFIYSGQLVGRKLTITDSKATTTTARTFTFDHDHFVNPARPTLAEIVAALNSFFTEASPTVASAGAEGELVITGAATAADGVLALGVGDANVLLGFPENGITIANGVGVTIPLPVSQQEYLHRNPLVDVTTYTPASGVRTKAADAGYSYVYTPASKNIVLTDVADAARQIAVSIRF